MNVEEQAIIDDEIRTIAKVYAGKEGGRPAYKTWQDAKAINPSITLDWTKSWFKLSMQPTKQVGGAEQTHVSHREPITSIKRICSL